MRRFGLLVAAGFIGLSANAAEAKDLRAELTELLQTHKRIEAALSDLEAAKERSVVASADWYPTLDVTTSYGWEQQKKGQGSDDTSIQPKVLETSLTQLLWDFGETNTAIERAKIEVTQSMQTLASVRQTLALEALNAHLNVIRQRKLLDFNQGSIDNVKRQMELEDARVQRGSGLATDVLQAKSQLAGLEATQTQINGALRTAMNRYRAVFGNKPTFEGGARKSKLPKLPLDLLPATLDDSIQVALENNPRLKATYLGTLIADQNVIGTRASEFYPELNAIVERNLKHDEGGTIGGKQETLVKVELTYSLNLGLTARNTLNVSKLTADASKSRFQIDRELVEERIRNAWSDLETAQRRLAQLQNQTNIASEFLELARRERQLGNRSLIDVLAGETALINSTSQAASAEIDLAQAVFRLLSAMGRLTADAIRE